ncbi:helix-turn-helix domain-containing protein [Streptomyces sp. NPDC021020]|uniref:helix-turn-helix domain-containing protein n=1 Tax=Streptomyces sp. NPDC021020 TaxID=3365109 RepID=UPI00378A00FF
MDLPFVSSREATQGLPPAQEFGVELARLRVLKGWSVRGLAERTAISEGHICNLQSGRRNPTAAVAAACDAALGADGALEALAGKARQGRSTGIDADLLISGYTRIFDDLRALGRTAGPSTVAAPMRSVAGLLADAAPRVGRVRRQEVWLIAARYAEYLGWMAQEAERPADALRWTDVAVRWAALGGDDSMAAYALVRRASIAQHRGDRSGVVDYARRAAGHPAATPRILVHAARREAQGHAVLGDYDLYRRALDRVRVHRAETAAGPEGPRWGPSIENGTPRVIEASCLVDLRRFGQAAGIFAVELQRAPATSADANSRARFAVRYATAQAGTGDHEGACRTVAEALPVIESVDSATVRAELRRFLGAADRTPAASRQHGVLNAVRAAAYRAA